MDFGRQHLFTHSKEDVGKVINETKRVVNLVVSDLFQLKKRPTKMRG